MFMDNTHIHKPTTIYKDMTEIVAHSMFFFNSLAKESFSCMAYTWGICYNLIVSRMQSLRVSLKLNPSLCLDSLLKGVLHKAHLGDEIGLVDEFG